VIEIYLFLKEDFKGSNALNIIFIICFDIFIEKSIKKPPARTELDEGALLTKKRTETWEANKKPNV
jgi:hypothetical protein